MPVLPQPVIAGIVLASGAGAVVMCLLVLRYGFAAPAEDSGERLRRETVTRLGHAVAGACFAAVAILAVVLVIHARPEPPVSLNAVPGERVAAVVDRLAALESRLDAVESRVVPLDARVADTRDRLGAVAARLERALDSRVQEIEARLSPVERRLERTEAARVGSAAARIERAEARVSAIEALVRQQTDDLVRATARLRQLEDQRASTPMRPAPTLPLAPEKPRPAEPSSGGVRWIPPGNAAAPAAPAPASPAASPASPAPPASAAPAPPLSPAPPPRPTSVAGPASRAVPSPEAPTGRTPDKADRPAQLGERIRDDWETVQRGFEEAGDDLRRALDSLRRNLRETLGR